MRVTLEEFLQLSKEDQAKVTWLDLTFATEDDRAKMRSRVNPLLIASRRHRDDRW